MDILLVLCNMLFINKWFTTMFVYWIAKDNLFAMLLISSIADKQSASDFLEIVAKKAPWRIHENGV